MNPRMQARIDAMNTGLSLTSDQLNQLIQILQNWMQQRRQLVQQNTPQEQIHEARRAMRQSVENLFTADQKQKYEANRQQYWQAGREDDDDNEQ